MVNKVDGMPRAAVLAQLQSGRRVGFPGVLRRFRPLRVPASPSSWPPWPGRLPEGPPLYPGHAGRLDGRPRVGLGEADERQWLGELVREQLLAVTRDELPYSIACQVTDWDWPYLRCEILVERGSQKGMVIGHGGAVLKKVGTAVRAQLPPGAYVELSVRVAQDWQRSPRCWTASACDEPS